jgi:hypothetical protein
MRGKSGGTEEGLKEVRMHKIDAFEQGAARGGEEERAVEDIRSRIHGWSVSERNEMGIGVVSEACFAETPERNSVGCGEGILGGLERKSTKGMGGISKTVVLMLSLRTHEIQQKDYDCVDELLLGKAGFPPSQRLEG